MLLDPSVKLEEVHRTDIFPDEKVVGIRASEAASFLSLPELYNPLANKVPYDVRGLQKETLNFIPFYARANRGGKGHMRVGLRVGPDAGKAMPSATTSNAERADERRRQE